jgi:membrane protein insertase Oxa1/YidC/SpoIIIJ
MVKNASNLQIELLSAINKLGDAIPAKVEEIFSAYGKTVADYSFDNTILGIELGGTPSLSEPSLLWLIPLFAVAGAFLQTFISQKFALKASKTRSSTIMAYSTCIISLIFSFTLPAAIGFYWGLSSFLGCVQTYFLGKKYDPNKYLEELEEQKRSEKEQAKIDRKLRRLERLKEIEAEQEAIRAKYRKK